MIYIVKKNDTLSKIAVKFSVPLELIMAFNRQIQDKNHIFIGQQIYIPNLEDIPDPKDVTPVTVQANALVARAQTAVGKGIRYELGGGGMNPASALPASNNRCDCSGFVCWVLGLSRKTDLPFYQKFGGWIYTDSMVEDINSQAGIFERITTPEIGCIVVYGAGPKIGHVGMVSEVGNGEMKKVIHCSAGNDKKFKDAIQETSPAVFNRADAVWGRFTMVR